MPKRPQLDTYWNRKSFAEKFWAQVDVRGPDECWPWQGKLSDNGYGMVHCPLVTFEGRHTAHRIGWFLLKGDPGPMLVRHKCNSRSCCNPDHWFVSLPAAEAAREKLEPQQVHDMRELLRSGVRTKDVAALHGVHPSTVRRVRRGDTWKFVA